MLVIDAANVIGSRPTGWWRDRAGAATRFVERVGAAVEAGDLDPPVVIVLEGQARDGVPPGTDDSIGIEVVHATGEGDDTLVGVAEAGDDVTIVTADRGLAERVRAVGAGVVGPSWLLARLGS
ncbi:MAG: hypothetical protein ACLFWR_11920 [Acidimicrobiales bacterium]